MLAAFPSTSYHLAADPLLPLRDQLLEKETVCLRLTSLFGVHTVGPCEIRRVKYRIGEGLKVLYEVNVHGTKEFVFARMPARHRLDQANLPKRSLQPGDSTFDPGLSTFFHRFPNDRKITDLRAFCRPASPIARSLVEPWARSEVVAYAPEKSVTTRCYDGGDRIVGYAKMYSEHDATTLSQTYRHFAGAAPVVKLLHHLPQYRMLFLAAATGVQLSTLSGREQTKGLESLGEGLGQFHRTESPVTLKRFTRHDLDRLFECARVVALARPDVSVDVTRLATDLYNTKRNSQSLVSLHGDVHPKNALMAADSVTLIDLDQSSFGPAASDLGSFLAWLKYQQIIGLITAARASVLRDSFLQGYSRITRLPDDPSLRWHTAAALLSERVLRSVNRIRTDGLFHLSQLINCALEVLRTGVRRV
jgi:hypothetical protein